ncbi:MAG: carboxymuconolactone decarboxylase family protein [Pseudomonadota bacterium]
MDPVHAGVPQPPRQACSTEATVPGYEAIREVLQERAIGERKVLPEADRLLAVIASLCIANRQKVLMVKLREGLKKGLEPRAISECLLQTGLYGGLPLVEEIGELLAAVFEEMGVSVDSEPRAMALEDGETLQESAKEYQRALHGERQQTGHADPMDVHTSELYKITSHYGYGMIWRRPGLTVRQRLIIAIASFATIGYVDSFLIKFARSATEHGMSVEEVREVIVQVSPYIGFPRALRALSLMREAFPDDLS